MCFGNGSQNDGFIFNEIKLPNCVMMRFFKFWKKQIQSQKFTRNETAKNKNSPLWSRNSSSTTIFCSLRYKVTN